MAKNQCALKLPGGVPAHVGTNRTVLDYGKLAFNARTAMEIFPCMAGAHIVRAWAGIEGMMADDIPVIGASSTSEGVWHAFGFSAHGFQLGPIVGAIVADVVTTGSTRFPIAPFSIERFKGSTGHPARPQLAYFPRA